MFLFFMHIKQIDNSKSEEPGESLQWEDEENEVLIKCGLWSYETDSTCKWCFQRGPS